MLTTKSVNELIIEEREFFIPDYQRGYRWTEIEIRQLLEDIRSFEKRDRNLFYCLQPLVVVPVQRDGRDVWEVVDGQQRLTTVHLILKYLDNPRFKRIEYERRDDSWSFIEKLSVTATPRIETIDAEYISRAYRTIETWFTEINKPEDLSKKAKIAYNIGDSVKFIWYEIDSAMAEGTQKIDVFNRLNIGKIGLTNAELIKALILQDDNFPDSGKEEPRALSKMQKYHIAYEWDAIERRLHDPDFWAFISKTNDRTANRIDLLFKLHAALMIQDDKDFVIKGEHGIFEFYLHKINRSGTSIRTKERYTFVLNIWNEVRILFYQLEEWFRNRELYHLVGFLISIGVSLSDLTRLSGGKKKSEFREAAIQCIRERLPDIDPRALSYTGKSSDDRNIQNYLLLFNIATILDYQKGDERISFRHFKGTDGEKVAWSLEHIHAQNSQYLQKTDEKNRWLEDHRDLLENIKETDPGQVDEIDRLLERIDKIDKVTMPREQFATLFDDVLRFFQDGEYGYDTDWIGNLTLLDSGSNSALGNSVFALKRKKIRERISRGSYVLPVTRNVFEKSYTENPTSLIFWTEDDRQAYVHRMRCMVNSLLGIEDTGDTDAE